MRLRSKPVNVHVELGGKIRTVEQLIRAFKKAVKEDGILKECKDRVRNYRTKGQKRRQKISRGKRRHARNSKRKKV
tara:strand:- start:234 stop:461 length:228 start_codon:yes stop_codon:yes gene_type:complete